MGTTCGVVCNPLEAPKQKLVLKKNFVKQKRRSERRTAKDTQEASNNECSITDATGKEKKLLAQEGCEPNPKVSRVERNISIDNMIVSSGQMHNIENIGPLLPKAVSLSCPGISPAIKALCQSTQLEFKDENFNNFQLGVDNYTNSFTQNGQNFINNEDSFNNHVILPMQSLPSLPTTPQQRSSGIGNAVRYSAPFNAQQITNNNNNNNNNNNINDFKPIALENNSYNNVSSNLINIGDELDQLNKELKQKIANLDLPDNLQARTTNTDPSDLSSDIELDRKSLWSISGIEQTDNEMQTTLLKMQISNLEHEIERNQ